MIIQITNEAYQKLRYFVQECDTEISGFGKVRPISVTRKVEVTKPGYFGFRSKGESEDVEMQALEIYDIEILPQVVSGVHATIDQDTLAKFLHKKMKSGEKIADYKVWWHSHVDMEAFFSGTDVGTIEGSTEFPYLISIVTNKRGEVLMRYDMYKPAPFTAYCELEVQPPQPDKKIRNWCRQQIRAKVKEHRTPLVEYKPTPDPRTQYLDEYDWQKDEPPMGQQHLHFDDQEEDDTDDDDDFDETWGIIPKHKRRKNNSGFGVH